VRIRIARKSLERVKRRIRQLTRRNQGRSWCEIKTRLETYIRGWVNYYALADAMKHMTRLDEWLRRRMRQLAWKQWKTPKNRRRNLRTRGVSEYWAKRVGGSSLGPPASKHNINYVILDRTAGCGPACPVVWEGGGFPSPYPDFKGI
jgi:hypothetical protein